MDTKLPEVIPVAPPAPPASEKKTRELSPNEKLIERMLEKRMAMPVFTDRVHKGWHWVLCCPRCWQPGIVFDINLDARGLAVIEDTMWFARYKRLEEGWRGREIPCQYCLSLKGERIPLRLRYLEEQAAWQIVHRLTRFLHQVNPETMEYAKHVDQREDERVKKAEMARDIAAFGSAIAPEIKRAGF